MLRKIFTAIIAASSFVFTSAQVVSVESTPEITHKAAEEKIENKPIFSITGSADFYYRYDFAKTKANNFTSFTNSYNSFALGMANVKFEHKTDKTSAVLDLGFGTRAAEFSYTDIGLLQAIKQLYVTYSPADWIKFTAGTWATHCNYELADAFSNRNYSMSYHFTFGPFSHTGLRADISKGKNGFMLGISNATDYRIPPDGQIKKKFLLAQYSYLGDKVQLYMNYVGGQAPDSSKSNFFNLILTTKISDKFGIVYNGILNGAKQWDGRKNMSAKTWWGSMLYFNYDPKKWMGLTLRTEYFNDNRQLNVFRSAVAGGSIFATTLSANFKVNTFTIIPELRFDNASENIFVDKNRAPKSSAASFLIAAVYTF
jgi:hypothetical protein